jgi:hypothetical protein
MRCVLLLDLIAQLPVGHKVIVKWARKWYRATVSEQGPVRMFKVHYRRWSDKYNESLLLSQLLTEEGKAIPREREAELVAGWQGQGWWEGHYYNVTIIGHTWGVAKVRYEGLEGNHDAYYPADRIQLVNEKSECVKLVENTPNNLPGNSNSPFRIEDVLDTPGSCRGQSNCVSMYSRDSKKLSSPTTRSASKGYRSETVLLPRKRRRTHSGILASPDTSEEPDVTRLVSLAQSMSSLVASGLFSDISFRCNDSVTLHGHKNIISVRSDYFKELLLAHPDQGVVDIEISSNIFHDILYYIYTGYVNVTFDSAMLLYEGVNTKSTIP